MKYETKLLQVPGLIYDINEIELPDEAMVLYTRTCTKSYETIKFIDPIVFFGELGGLGNLRMIKIVEN